MNTPLAMLAFAALLGLAPSCSKKDKIISKSAFLDAGVLKDKTFKEFTPKKEAPPAAAPAPKPAAAAAHGGGDGHGAPAAGAPPAAHAPDPAHGGATVPGVPCHSHHGGRDYGEGCVEAFNVKVGNLDFIAVHYEKQEQAYRAAMGLNQYTYANWVLDEVTREPSLERFVKEAFGAENPRLVTPIPSEH